MLRADGLISESLYMIRQGLPYFLCVVVFDADDIQRVFYKLFLNKAEKFAIVFYLAIDASVGIGVVVIVRNRQGYAKSHCLFL